MPIAGAMVLIINGFVFRNKFTIFKGNGWKMLLVGAALFTAADFLWYDSINKIGSGKTMLLTIPAEDVFIVLLAVVFLAERMLKLQLLGIGVAIVGFTISAASNVSESGCTVSNRRLAGHIVCHVQCPCNHIICKADCQI